MTHLDKHLADRVPHAELRAALVQLDKMKADKVARTRASRRGRSGRRRLQLALIGLGVGAWVGDAALGQPLPVAVVFASVGLVMAAVTEIRVAFRR